jgi:hypothetical protein
MGGSRSRLAWTKKKKKRETLGEKELKQKAGGIAQVVRVPV